MLNQVFWVHGLKHLGLDSHYPCWIWKPSASGIWASARLRALDSDAGNGQLMRSVSRETEHGAGHGPPAGSRWCKRMLAVPQAARPLSVFYFYLDGLIDETARDHKRRHRRRLVRELWAVTEAGMRRRGTWVDACAQGQSICMFGGTIDHGDLDMADKLLTLSIAETGDSNQELDWVARPLASHDPRHTVKWKCTKQRKDFHQELGTQNAECSARTRSLARTGCWNWFLCLLISRSLSLRKTENVALVFNVRQIDCSFG